MDYLQGTLDCRMVGAGRSTFHGLFLAQHVHHDQRINLICTLTKLPHLSKSTYLDQRVVTASLHSFSEGGKDCAIAKRDRLSVDICGDRKKLPTREIN